MIFPVGFATIFAVLMGNFINHGLYHSLIDVTSSVQEVIPLLRVTRIRISQNYIFLIDDPLFPPLKASLSIISEIGIIFSNITNSGSIGIHHDLFDVYNVVLGSGFNPPLTCQTHGKQISYPPASLQGA